MGCKSEEKKHHQIVKIIKKKGNDIEYGNMNDVYIIKKFKLQKKCHSTCFINFREFYRMSVFL